MDERNGTGRYDMEKKRLSLNEEDMLQQIWDGGNRRQTERKKVCQGHRRKPRWRN